MIDVAVGILLQGNSVLVCQRRKSARYALKWEFPGGKVEKGESNEECLRRELREELSVEAVVGKEFHRQTWVYPDSGTFRVFYFLVTSFTGSPRNNTFEQIRWVTVDQLGSVDMLEGNSEVVQKLLRGEARTFMPVSER